MSQILLIVGAAILGLLGSIHLFYTFFSEKFAPVDSSLADAMKATNPKLTRETSMWMAWLGFNASHSLGVIFFAAIYIPLSLWHFEVIRQSLWFSLMPVVVGFCYLYLAKRYWFKVPLLGILIATLCFAVASIHIYS